jgi:BolA protein
MIRARLEQTFSPARLDITDESHLHRGHAGAASGAGHFSVVITSAAFSGQTMVQRHRLVYRAVSDMMPGEIHALSIQALAPEEI